MSDKALIDAYKEAKQLKLSDEFIILIEQEMKKRKLVH
ncbi:MULTISPECIES: sporulation histidine kinase inhibitor Sda [Rossellomorea]|nr:MULTISPECIES: sporulation histidine kinase inhibitor Sda [Rossellomorea]WGG48075.1 sporulation histidine kinase inhibitor Sda [Rossellomorea sp. DA94]